MNWLAHVFLSEESIDYRLGNLLADKLKGRAWPQASEEFKAGLAKHRQIDMFTDQHPIFVRSKQRLGQSGILRGVVVDIVYDHYLARQWQRYSESAFDLFLDGFYRDALAAITHYPENAKRFVIQLISSDRLRRYQNHAGLKESLALTDSRLSPRLKRRETTSSYMPVIDQLQPELAQDFTDFFPQLIEHCQLNT